MKLINFTLLLLSCFFLNSIQAQNIEDIKIKGSYTNESLALVLLDIEINHRLTFEFEKKALEGIIVTQQFRKTRLKDAMSFLLHDTGLTFSLKAPRTVVISKDDQINNQEKEILVATSFDFTLSGVIKDRSSGETLPFATVSAIGTSLGTSTNVDGYFTLFNVPSDTIMLEIQYLGYRTSRVRLSAETDKANALFFMDAMGQQLTEVLVVAEKEEQLIKASTGISKVGLSPAQVATLPSFGEKDIFRSLQLLPGVSGTNESSSGLYVRGGTPDQNLILFDGFTVYHVDHLFGFFSAFNSNAVKDVQLYKGGFESKYGGRLSSVVDLTGKDGNTEQFNTGFGLSLVSVNAFIESPFAKGKGSFLIAARRSFQSDFYNNLFDSFVDTNNAVGPGGGGRFGQQEVQPNSHFYDVNVKMTYRPTTKDVISFSFYNGQDDLDNSRNTDQNSFQRPGGGNPDFTFQSNNTDLTKWGNWGTSGKWSHKWSDKLYTSTHISYSNYYSERDRSNETTIEQSDTTINRNTGSYESNDLKDVTLKIENEWKISSENQLEFGIQSTFQDIEYLFSQNDTISILDRKDKGLTTSFYLQDKHTFNNKLILSGGLRTSHYEVTGDLYFEPRASLTYLVNDRIKLKGAWGQYYQFATRIIREDVQQGSRDFWVLANDQNIPISSSQHFIAGLSYETPTFLFDVEAYYKTLDGLSEYTTRFVTNGFGPNRSLDYEELFYQGTGTAKGLEFLIQKKVGRLTGWLGYTLGEVNYDFPAFGETSFPANQDQRHELKLVGNYKLGVFDLSATFVFATGKPYTAPTGYYELTLLDGTKTAYFDVSDKNALRLPNYHRLDISATYNFNMGNSKASLGCSVFNLYNRKNVWYNEYEVIEGELLETAVSLLNVTPSLFFTWNLR